MLLERLRFGSDGRSCLIPDSEITASRPRDNSFCISYEQFKSTQLTLQNFICSGSYKKNILHRISMLMVNSTYIYGRAQIDAGGSCQIFGDIRQAQWFTSCTDNFFRLTSRSFHFNILFTWNVKFLQ